MCRFNSNNRLVVKDLKDKKLVSLFTDFKTVLRYSREWGKQILFSHWLRILQMLEISVWQTRIHFPPPSDLSLLSIIISQTHITDFLWIVIFKGSYVYVTLPTEIRGVVDCGLNVARISWNFEWYQGLHRRILVRRFQAVFRVHLNLLFSYLSWETGMVRWHSSD